MMLSLVLTSATSPARPQNAKTPAGLARRRGFGILLFECSVPLRRAHAYAYYAYSYGNDGEETGGRTHDGSK
ncbi:conserved protein of unknown function [Thauera humireducens]|nr:conserved protein of unknown function [Thauera humireducens]